MIRAREQFDPASFADYRAASRNYLHGLNIPRGLSPDFVIVTDRTTRLLGRQILADEIAELAGKRFPRSRVSFLAFPEEMSDTWVHRVIDQVKRKSPHMVGVLLSGQHPWRFGVYDGIEKSMAPQGKFVRFGYSPGMTAADVAILAQIDESKLGQIVGQVQRRADWFRQKKSGILQLTSGGNSEHALMIPFNMAQAPIIASTGKLTDENRKGNLHSGEAHLVPFPFRKSYGTVATDSGLIISVHDGLAVDVTIADGAGLLPEEARFVERIRTKPRGERGIPLAELGNGVLEESDIQVKEHPSEPDGQMSILSREKLKLHLGFGVLAGRSTEKKTIEKKLKGSKTHTDMLVRNPVLLHENEVVQFA